MKVDGSMIVRMEMVSGVMLSLVMCIMALIQMVNVMEEAGCTNTVKKRFMMASGPMISAAARAL